MHSLNFKVVAFFFFFEVYFEAVAPKMHTNQLTNGVYFFDKVAGWVSATLPKICSPTRIFNICAQICSYLYRVFQNLRTSANRCKVLRIFISMKVTVYIQNADNGLGKDV